MLSPIEAVYPEVKFGGFSDVDGTIAFYSRVQALAGPQSHVLDVGCGRGAASEDEVAYRREIRCLRQQQRHVIGIDVDPVGARNPLIDEFRIIQQSGEWPVGAAEVDIVICDFVLEHLDEPAVFFSEAKRVLKTGGFLCIRTANILSYFGLAARVFPDRLHASIVLSAQTNRRHEDVFRTAYRCNTVFAIRKEMRAHGFASVVYGYDAEPGYLKFSRLAYRLGALYGRVVPNLLRTSIFAFGQVT